MWRSATRGQPQITPSDPVVSHGCVDLLRCDPADRFLEEFQPTGNLLAIDTLGQELFFNFERQGAC